MRTCFSVLFFIKELLASPLYEEVIPFEGKKASLLGHFTRVFSEVLEGVELSSEEAALKSLCELLNVQIPNIPPEPLVGVEKELYSLVPSVEKYITRKVTAPWCRDLWKTGVLFSLKESKHLTWKTFFETLLFSFQDIKPVFKKGSVLCVFNERLVTLTQVFEVFKAWHVHHTVPLARMRCLFNRGGEAETSKLVLEKKIEQDIKSYLVGDGCVTEAKALCARECVFNMMWSQGILSSYICQWFESTSQEELQKKIRALNQQYNLKFDCA